MEYSREASGWASAFDVLPKSRDKVGGRNRNIRTTTRAKRHEIFGQSL